MPHGMFEYVRSYRVAVLHWNNRVASNCLTNLFIISCKPHEKRNKKHQNAKSIGKKLKTNGLMFFYSFTSCDLEDFKI